jgi:hypothetical protein
LLLVFALAFGGVANAWAAQDCPYKDAPSAHGCCPDGAAPDNGQSEKGSKSAVDCKLGQACRSAPATAPNLPSVDRPVFAIEPASVVLAAGPLPASPPFSLWRPPRTV